MTRFLCLMVLLLAAGCASKFEAPIDAKLSTAPDAPGYVVVALATQTYRYEFGHATMGLGMTLNRDGGQGVAADRSGCGSLQGAYGSKACDLSKLDYQVLVVPAGEWMPVYVLELSNNWGTKKLLRDKLPQGTPVHVGPGEIVYIGDFTYASDYDAQEIKLVTHGRDDAAASAVLAKYPGLKNAPILYRDPTRVPS